MRTAQLRPPGERGLYRARIGVRLSPEGAIGVCDACGDRGNRRPNDAGIVGCPGVEKVTDFVGTCFLHDGPPVLGCRMELANRNAAGGDTNISVVAIRANVAAHRAEGHFAGREAKNGTESRESHGCGRIGRVLAARATR